MSVDNSFSDDDIIQIVAPERKPQQPAVQSKLQKKVKRGLAERGRNTMRSWMVSSFGGEEDVSQDVRSSNVTGESWAQQSPPTNRSQLVIHKKKIDELECWLFRSQDMKGTGNKCLLITGPPGCGKATCLYVLAKEMGLEVHEWTNPISRVEQAMSDEHYGESQTSIFHKFLNAANKYQSLAMLNNNYDDDCRDNDNGGDNDEATGKGRIVVIKDLPGVFYRDHSALHNTLRWYNRCGRHPLVLIASDTQHRSTSIFTLLNRNRLAEFGVHHISFNSVAHTSMMKMLERVATSQERDLRSRRASKQDLEEICFLSDGDMRSAINSLQFLSCGKESHSKSQPNMTSSSSLRSSQVKHTTCINNNTSSSQLPPTSTINSIGNMDSPLFLFRALGKILHCKRKLPDTHSTTTQKKKKTNKELKSEIFEEISVPSLPLPPHLHYLYRDPLLVNPEVVLDKCSISSDLLTLYLHENYLEFMWDVGSASTASDYLSLSDLISTLTPYSQSSEVNKMESCDYPGSIACRGLMFSKPQPGLPKPQPGLPKPQPGLSKPQPGLSKPQPGLPKPQPGFSTSFKPLYKPKYLEHKRSTERRWNTAQSLFQSYMWRREELVMSMLPYLNKIDVTLRNQEQVEFLHELCRFSRGSGRRADRLCETDNDTDEVADDDNNRWAGPSCSQTTLQQSNDDDYLIEDDDDGE